MPKRRRAKRRSKGALTGIALAVLGGISLGLGSLIFHAEKKLSALVLGGLGEAFPTKIYSAPLIIHEHARLSPHRLINRLKRLGYKITAQEPSSAGEYSWQDPILKIYLRALNLPQTQESSRLVSLELTDENQWRLENSNDSYAVILEPILLSNISGAHKLRRDPAQWSDFPKDLIHAVISAEDKRFFTHWGVDPKALLRAIWRNIRGRGTLQGGSTITQQLAKNLLLTPRRTLTRKIAEAALSLYLEIRLSKEEILTLYLNHIYLGQDGSTSITGMKAAAEFYFGKSLQNLTTGESALLAGLIRSPYRYNPFRDPETTLKRRHDILKLMSQNGFIDAASAQSHAKESIHLRSVVKSEGAAYGYYISEVLRELSLQYEEDDLMRLGFHIYTAMDPDMQEAAQRTISLSRYQGALVALDQSSGYVLALTGGRDFSQSQFNRATQAKRQPGSAIKPFIYATALEQGWTPASTILDEPKSLKTIHSSPWEPKNYDGVYHGTVTLRQALNLSLNAATIDLSQKVGLSKILEMLQRLGITSEQKEYPALALGVFEVSPLEIIAAYAPFANGGFKIEPRLITTVIDSTGATLDFSPIRRVSVLDPALSSLMTSLLESVVTEGTAKSLSKLGWQRTAAGKTGTANDGRDAWFIGYTPELLAGVWIGDDEHRAIGVSGPKDALPIWASFMKEALADYPPSLFSSPQGLISVEIDTETGLRATSDCPSVKEEIFVAGTEPQKKCALHQKSLFEKIRQWWKK